MSKLFTHYANLMIPGLNEWPRYEQANTQDFWINWKRTSPFTTQFALASCIVLIAMYCNVNSLRGFKQEQSLSNMAASPFFMVRQSYLMLKTLACLAYFSDPSVYKLATIQDVENKAH